MNGTGYLTNAHKLQMEKKGVVIQTSNGDTFIVENKYIDFFVIIKTHVEFSENDESDENVTFPLNNINSEIFKKIFEWVKYRVDNDMDNHFVPTVQTTQNDPDDPHVLMDNWETKHFGEDFNEIKKITLASNFLGITLLTHKLLKKISILFRKLM